jgi:hypothetical protein
MSVEEIENLAAYLTAQSNSTDPAAPKETSDQNPKEPKVADQTIYDARVTAIRVASPTLSLTEARKLARDHAQDEGFYAPPLSDSGLDSIALNDNEAPSLRDRLIADLEADPKVADAIRWGELTDAEKQAEKDGAALLKRVTELQADEAARVKGTGFVPQSIEQFLTNSEADPAIRKAARAIFEREAAARSTLNEGTVLDARSDVDSQFAALVRGEDAAE